MLLGGGMLAIFGSKMVDWAGAGPLGCLTISFVAALRWRSEVPKGKRVMLIPIYLLCSEVSFYIQPFLVLSPLKSDGCIISFNMFCSLINLMVVLWHKTLALTFLFFNMISG